MNVVEAEKPVAVPRPIDTLRRTYTPGPHAVFTSGIWNVTPRKLEVDSGEYDESSAADSTAVLSRNNPTIGDGVKPVVTV